MLDDGDQQFLQSLQGRQLTITELCEQAGVTATAIRQRLSRLQAQGLIDRVVVKTGRGRPHHAYELTDAGRRSLGDNSAELAMVMWSEVRQLADPTVRERLLGRIREQLVARYGADVPAGGSLEEKLDRLRSTLVERGFGVEVVSATGLPVLRERFCPYHDLAAQDRGICELEQQVFEQVLGVPLVLTQCCRDGDVCCEFRPAIDATSQTPGLDILPTSGEERATA